MPPTDPKNKYYDDQDIFQVDFDQLYSSFITSIDAIRSHFNALNPNSQELNTPQYQESRCSAFFRMIGFPIVSSDGNFHSPGFDPNLNTDTVSTATNQKTDTSIINDNNIKTQLNNRELLVNQFNTLFAAGGINAQAALLGSVFIRSFDKQFSGTDPLTLDPSQTQNVNERFIEITNFYGSNGFLSSSAQSILTTVHLLKPFIVDPRIDSTIRPIKNRICAPFLKDKSQTKIFQSSTGASENLKRPYIERVISVRFNNKNVSTNPGSDFINGIINDIKSNDKITDPTLIQTTSNTLSTLYSSELTIFNNYFKIMRITIEKLVSSIRSIQHIRQIINFNPIPDPKNGIESGVGPNQLAQLNPNDVNNKDLENDIILLTQKKYLNDTTFDAGIQGVPDPGDFVFSNIDDSVFSINKNIQKSYDDNITKATNLRTQSGNEGIDYLRNIEIIMGEFSGIGLIDMIAIQSALWIMPANSLLGLIDKRAFTRLQQFRKDINVKTDSSGNAIVPNFVITSLTDFEATLKTVYLLIQDYFNSINNGSAYTAA